MLKVVPILLCLCCSMEAHGWGERGHRLVTLAAVQLLQEEPEAATFAKPFVDKRFMLAHLSNIPDIHWRNIDKKISALNGPTHYINLEYLSGTPRLKDIPSSIEDMFNKVKQNCASQKICPKSTYSRANAISIGTAPWRIDQLFRSMTKHFSTAKAEKKPNNKKLTKLVTKAVNDGLLDAGLLSHFIGDLANPMHNTRNYDGWDTGQGGLHRYFETDVVNAYDLDLINEVLAFARAKKPEAALLAQLGRTSKPNRVPAFVRAFILDAYKRKGPLFAMDRKVGLLKQSATTPIKIPAQRIPAAAAAPHYKQFVIERLGTAAAALAFIWRSAWELAGKPSFKGYQSFHYYLAPDFVPLPY